MSESNDMFYTRVCDIREKTAVRKRREQLATDISTGVLVPTQLGCELLFERVGLIREVFDVEAQILSALLDKSDIFTVLLGYGVTVRCACAFVELRMIKPLLSVACKRLHGMDFYWKVVVVLQKRVTFSYCPQYSCSLHLAPLDHLREFSVHEPVVISDARQCVPEFIVKTYNANKNAVKVFRQPDRLKGWWRVGVSQEEGDQFLMIAMAAYACPSGPWPLRELPLHGKTLSQFRENYLTKRAHFDTLKTYLKDYLDTVRCVGDALRQIDLHHLLGDAPRSVVLAGSAISAAVEKLKRFDEMQIDCNRVFRRVWADACDIILAIQQSALSCCGQTLPHYIVLDLLRLVDDGVTVLVEKELRLIALIQERTNRALVLYEAAQLQRQNEQMLPGVAAQSSNKRKFDAVSADNEEVKNE
jgi:hypothetical protein